LASSYTHKDEQRYRESKELPSLASRMTDGPLATENPPDTLSPQISRKGIWVYRASLAVGLLIPIFLETIDYNRLDIQR
jgi:hypothetical protein